MKKNFLFLAFICLSSVFFAQKSIDKTMVHGGITRNYRIYIPKNYNAAKAVPLVFNLHGYTSNEVQQELYADFRAVADTAGFIIVHPRGTLQPQTGQTYWNANMVINGVDDFGFINKLIDTLSINYKINPKKIYSAGMSNGGIMSYELACRNPRFAAIASVTGTMLTQNYALCKPSSPIPVMEIHGTADAVVAYEGTAAFKHIDTVVTFWAKHNGCNPTPEITDVPNKNTADGVTAKRFLYKNGKKGTTVELYKVIGGGHTWPGAILTIGATCQDFSASREIWRFFNQFSLTTNTNDVIKNIDFELFPNPTFDFFTLRFNDSEIKSLQITDLQGKVVFNQKIIDFQQNIDVSNFPKGIYTVKIQDENGFGLRKLVIE